MLRRLSPTLLAIVLLAGAGCHDEPAAIAAVEGLPDGADAYLQHLATRCDGGSGRHCWYLGYLYRLGGGGLRADAARATAFFERTCGPLGVYGCQEAGEARKAAGDDAGAVERWDRGCRGGRERPCMSILRLHEAREVPFLEATALGCRAGNESSCRAVARAVADIDPTPAGAVTEESLLPPGTERAILHEAMRCDRRTGTMCTALAERYLAATPPPGMERDVEHARRLGQRACTDQNVTGCAILGRLAMESDPPDRERAEQLLVHACDGGSLKGCQYLVDLLEPRDSEEELRRRDVQLELCLVAQYATACAPVRAWVGAEFGSRESTLAAQMAIRVAIPTTARIPMPAPAGPAPGPAPHGAPATPAPTAPAPTAAPSSP